MQTDHRHATNARGVIGTVEKNKVAKVTWADAATRPPEGANTSGQEATNNQSVSRRLS